MVSVPGAIPNPFDFAQGSAALEAATLSGYQIKFERLPAFRTPRRVRLIYVQFLDPCIAIQHLVTFTLQLQTSWHVGNARSTLITSVDA